MRALSVDPDHGADLTTTTSGAAVQIKLLVEEGGANVWVRDRWGKTPYDEARRVGATAVAEFLKLIMDRCDTILWISDIHKVKQQCVGLSWSPSALLL